MTKPFLKWAGGKQRLLENILPHLLGEKRLIEPFVGSGAVFLNTDFKSYLLADSNDDLIQLYLYLQSEGKEFIDYCKQFFIPETNQAERYYELRALFNSSTDRRLKSALFIYLNRHAYNGLCRYNSSGYFNAPFGRYINPALPEIAMKNFFDKVKNAKFVTADFVKTMQKSRPGDIIYCDPPYVPLSATANFTNYCSAKFGEIDQLQLAKEAEDLAKKGVTVVISNHDTEFTRHAYRRASIIVNFSVKRWISCDSANRNDVTELIAIFQPD